MAINSDATDAATVARGYFEAVGRRDLDAMTAFYKPGGTRRDLRLGRAGGAPTPTGPGSATSSSLPRLQLEIIEVVPAGEKAAVRWRATGTFDGTARFEGLDPNGARSSPGLRRPDHPRRPDRAQRRLHERSRNGAPARRPAARRLGAGAVMTGALNLKTRLAKALRERRR